MTARILIIAGSDSGGGAGIQADIKTVTMLGGHAMTAITAITAQNTVGVQAVQVIPTEMVIAQIDSVISDIGVDAIKIGMIGSAETAARVADRLAGLGVPIVFDPVMVATSGSALADPATIAVFERLIKCAALVTPNLPELVALGGEDALIAMGTAVLIKGGHGEGKIITDRLVTQEGEIAHWASDRIETTSTHGTGCTLASAIAVGLGEGMEIEPAIARARLFVRMALRGAPGFGGGHGPMGHQSVRQDVDLSGPSLNQITIGCDDYDASVAFYKAIGLRQIVDSGSNGYARFETAGGTTLSIHQGGVPSLATTLYFESARLDSWVKELSDAGLVFTKRPTDESWGWREAELFDHFGNRILLYHAGENRRYPPWRI